MENAAAFPTIQPLDYVYEKQDTTACPIWFEENVSTNLDKIIHTFTEVAAFDASAIVAGTAVAITGVASKVAKAYTEYSERKKDIEKKEMFFYYKAGKLLRK